MFLKHKDWDVGDIATQIHSLSRQCSNHYCDGFTAFELKKELYLLKEIIDQSLNDAPEFGEIEKHWLTEQEKKRIINILKSE
jgi:hypothetical protein